MRAERTIRKLRAKMAAIRAPKDALPVRRDLLRLLDREVAFAHDVVRLGIYTPRLGAVLKDAGTAGRALQLELQTKSAKVQAKAFRAYATVLDRDAARMRRLDPPTVVLAAHISQLQTIAQSADVSRRIARALEHHKRALLSSLIQRLGSFSSLANRRRVHRAQVIAIKAFNNRLLAMNRLSARIQRERAALERRL